MNFVKVLASKAINLVILFMEKVADMVTDGIEVEHESCAGKTKAKFSRKVMCSVSGVACVVGGVVLIVTTGNRKVTKEAFAVGASLISVGLGVSLYKDSSDARESAEQRKEVARESADIRAKAHEVKMTELEIEKMRVSA